eukprot:Partr_v1_DN26368_c1_g1_i2_m42957 putative Mitochondrial
MVGVECLDSIRALFHGFFLHRIVCFYRSLSVNRAWIEAATKGAVLLFTASEIEYLLKTRTNLSAATGGILAGMTGGVAQAYTTMGFCTFMKTVEITRHKGASAGGAAAKTSLQIAGEIWRKEGIRGINRGVNAVALRQCTNWGSRIGLSRFAEDSIKRARGDHVDHSVPLSPGWKIVASTFGGALSCWNQPIEVIRVEMQSQIKSEGRPERMSIMQTSKWIYERNGIRGFFRGVIPRVGLGAWQTVCMVAGGDALKQRVKEWQEQRDAKGGKY